MKSKCNSKCKCKCHEGQKCNCENCNCKDCNCSENSKNNVNQSKDGK